MNKMHKKNTQQMYSKIWRIRAEGNHDKGGQRKTGAVDRWYLKGVANPYETEPCVVETEGLIETVGFKETTESM